MHCGLKTIQHIHCTWHWNHVQVPEVVSVSVFSARKVFLVEFATREAVHRATASAKSRGVSFVGHLGWDGTGQDRMGRDGMGQVGHLA